MEGVLTATQISSVQGLWATMEQDWPRLGEELLRSLVKKYPRMEDIFFHILTLPDKKRALREHGSKILRMLDIVIDKLDTPWRVEKDLKTLGARHPEYGVLPNVHKEPMKTVLFELIKSHSSGHFDEEAWDATWVFITDSMGLFDLYTVWY